MLPMSAHPLVEDIEDVKRFDDQPEGEGVLITPRSILR